MTIDYVNQDTWPKCPGCAGPMLQQYGAVPLCSDCRRSACPRCSPSASSVAGATLCGDCEDSDRRAASAAREDLRRRAEALHSAGIPLQLAWANFAAGELLRARVVDASAVAVAKHFTAGRAVLSGPTGAGKSSLAGCILRRSLESHPTPLSAAWADSFALVAARATWRLGTEEPELIARAKHCGALVLDDLGAEAVEPYAKTIVEIIHARYAAARPITVVTTQLSLDELAARYGSSVARRLFEGATKIRVRHAEEFHR